MDHVEGAFEWDVAKDRANAAKHGVTFQHALRIFTGPVALERSLLRDNIEDRWIAVGTADGAVVVLTVVYVERGARRRLISARPASRRERKRYEEAIREASDAR